VRPPPSDRQHEGTPSYAGLICNREVDAGRVRITFPMNAYRDLSPNTQYRVQQLFAAMIEGLSAGDDADYFVGPGRVLIIWAPMPKRFRRIAHIEESQYLRKSP
jgi:hypothetical protein